MSRTITIIRHAQQVSHRQIDSPIIASPPPLTVPYDAIITSPYLRCRQTSQARSAVYPGQTSLACSGQKVQKPIHVDVRISEYQGHKRPLHQSLDPTTSAYGPIPLYEETWEQFRTRLDSHWEYIRGLKESLLIVTHGIVVNYFSEKINGTKMYPRGRDVPFASGFTINI